MKMSLDKARAILEKRREAEEARERVVSPRGRRGSGNANVAPNTARSSCGTSRPTTRSSTAVTDLSMFTVGYTTHRYRSELRYQLREMGLHQTQQANWGQPAHFVPMLQLPDESRPPSKRSYRRKHGSFSSDVADAKEWPESTAETVVQRDLQRRDIPLRRPSTARVSHKRPVDHERPTTARSAMASMQDRRDPRPPASRSRLDSCNSIRSQCATTTSGGSGFRPPAAWSAFMPKPAGLIEVNTSRA